MASDKEYLHFVLEQLDNTKCITYRAMMGEYILYYNGKIFGGIYDNRFLVKPLPAILEYIADKKYETPYPGAKPMLLIDEVDNREFLSGLINALKKGM